ncbi:Mpo1-like protein [Salinithrix halophila]|uniref:Mpo1-like protein n=1 Tax=Salinithrix halophila TaxID=1485204 RepID=A0ABV8JH59_9BACL
MNISKLLDEYRKDHQHPVNQLTHAVGIPMIALSLPWFFFNWKTAAVLFVLGWILQFVGHLFEGKKPSFFRNPAFLIIGPWWWMKKRLGRTDKSEDSRSHKEEQNL